MADEKQTSTRGKQQRETPASIERPPHRQPGTQEHLGSDRPYEGIENSADAEQALQEQQEMRQQQRAKR
jgi:hypothetical protein